MPDITEARPAVDTWHNRAACRFEDPEAWFPLPSQDNQDAKNICLGCPVRYDCGADAVRNRDRHGIRAGFLLPTQSRSLRRYLAAAESDRAAAELLADHPESAAERPRVCGKCGEEFYTTRRRQMCWACGGGADASAVLVAEHVRALRATFDWSYREIARRAGVDPGTITRITSGRLDRVTASTAERVLAVTGPNVEAVAS